MNDAPYDWRVDPTIAAAAEEQRALQLSRPQWEALQARERYLSLEGAYRSGKTTIALLKVGVWCWDYPGIPWLLARWTAENTFAQLRPDFLALWGDRVYQWLADEGCYLMHSKTPGVYSRVYFSGLKPQDGLSPFSKIHGKKFACAVVDQPEEMPEAYFDHLHTRLSAPGFPQQLIICPNPQLPTHWVSEAFPEDNSRRVEGYRLIKFRMRDNVAALGEEYVGARERELQKKPAEYRRAILGERGLPMAGKPVYSPPFNRDRHVRPTLAFNPSVPLIESWDFGHRHPAVTWTQYPLGNLHILGGVMGSDMHLERFIPEVETLRKEWFPSLDPLMLWWTADPAGSAKNSHGSRTAFDILADFGIVPRLMPDANTPPAQDAAIQVISGYLGRNHTDGSPTFALHPRFMIVSATAPPKATAVLVDGFELGLCWDEDRTYNSATYPNVRPWKRDPWFSHSFVTLHYSAIAFAPADAAEQVGLYRNDGAKKRAVAILRSRGSDISADKLSTVEAAEILRIKAQHQQEREAAKALRRTQRDDGEPFRWTSYVSLGRGGY